LIAGCNAQILRSPTWACPAAMIAMHAMTIVLLRMILAMKSPKKQASLRTTMHAQSVIACVIMQK